MSSSCPEDPKHPIEVWKHEVAHDETRLGYEHWLAGRREESNSDSIMAPNLGPIAQFNDPTSLNEISVSQNVCIEVEADEREQISHMTCSQCGEFVSHARMMITGLWICSFCDLPN